jgi:hypothetical protein
MEVLPPLYVMFDTVTPAPTSTFCTNWAAVMAVFTDNCAMHGSSANTGMIITTPRFMTLAFLGSENWIVTKIKTKAR